jgi:large subunit ribosomal protein L5
MSTQTYKPRLATKYTKDVVPALVKKFGYSTMMQAPRLEKICLNRGVNGAVNDKKLIDISLDELTTISGQKAVSTMSKKTFRISNSEKQCRSVQELRCVVIKCMSFLTG